jgi:hypothetical protein
LKECIAQGTDTTNLLSEIGSIRLLGVLSLRANMTCSKGCLPLGPFHGHTNFPDFVIYNK